MSINNLAIHHEQRLSGKNSIASMCAARLGINRPLKIVGGYNFIESKNDAVYRDKLGRITTRKAIAAQYKVSVFTVYRVFDSNDQDFKLAHKELKAK